MTPSPQPQHDRLLRHALRSNAVFSTASGLAFIIASSALSTFLGPPQLALQIVGAGLLLFALDLFHQSTRPRLHPGRALMASISDFAWVLGTAGLGLFAPHALTSAGWIAAFVVAVIVAGLGTAQLMGLRRLALNRLGHSTARSSWTLERAYPDVSPEALWDVVSDIGHIDRYAPDLASVELDGPPALNTRRHCTNQKGEAWTEQITHWQPSHGRFTLRFETEAEDDPFPFTEAHGGWSVDACQNGGARLAMWLEFSLPGGLVGDVLAALLAPQLDKNFAPVLDRMAEAVRSGGSSLELEPPSRALSRLAPIPC